MHDKGLDALVICAVPQEETGRDRSLFSIESEEDIGYTAIERALSKVGFSDIFQHLWHDPNRPPGWTYLVEVYGFIGSSSEQVALLQDELDTRVARIIQLGGYSTPLEEADLAHMDDDHEAGEGK